MILRALTCLCKHKETRQPVSKQEYPFIADNIVHLFSQISTTDSNNISQMK